MKKKLKRRASKIKPSKITEEMQEALVWHKERNGIRCDLCGVNCFISRERIGACNLRKNVDNKLFTLNWKVTGLNFDTVEKRPLYHFYPGAKSLSVSGMGDENWTISHDQLPRNDKKYSPEGIVKLAENKNTNVISFTGYEPSIFFEFAYRTAKFAYRSNIKNVLVTNGLITGEAVKKISKYLDAVVVNLRGSGDLEVMKKFTLVQNMETVFRAMKQMKKQHVHIEIANTIVPQIGDSLEACKKLAEWVSSELTSSVPIHIIQFHPDNRFPDLPFTPIETLEACADTTRKSGIRYVYIGNLIQPHEQENTYCYNCREILIERVSGILKKNRLHKERCSNCGVKVEIVV